jgi:hypothetical protein
MVIRSPEGPWRENFPASSGSSLDFESPCHLLSKDESAIFFVFPPRAVAENLLPTRYMACKGSGDSGHFAPITKRRANQVIPPLNRSLSIWRIVNCQSRCQPLMIGL